MMRKTVRFSDTIKGEGAQKVLEGLGGIKELFMNRRTRSPTFYGWMVILIVGFVFLNIVLKRSSSPGLKESSEQDVPEFAKFHAPAHPKLRPFAPKIEDPQLDEFKAIHKKNLKGDEPPELPVFDVNIHDNSRHKKKEEKDLNRFGMPQPKDFPVDIKLKPTLPCGEDNTVPLLIVVHTRPDATGYRSAIRRTWGIQDDARYMFETQKWAVIFAVGHGGEHFDDMVQKENEEFGDMLQGEFFDSPFEDTRKFMMAMEWITHNYENCKPHFIMKTVDKIFLNMHAIVPWVEAVLEGRKSVYIGRLQRREKPNRDKSDPHFVSKQDYEPNIYPDMIESPVYMFSEDAFTKMSKAMSFTVPISAEDAYVAILAKRAGITPKHNDHFQMLSKTSNICHHLQLFFIYDVMPYEHIETFQKLINARKHPDCRDMQVMDRFETFRRGGSPDL